MKTESIVPITPEKAPKIIYKVPISLWLVEKSHLSKNNTVGLFKKLFILEFCIKKIQKVKHKLKT